MAGGEAEGACPAQGEGRKAGGGGRERERESEAAAAGGVESGRGRAAIDMARTILETGAEMWS